MSTNTLPSAPPFGHQQPVTMFAVPGVKIPIADPAEAVFDLRLPPEATAILDRVLPSLHCSLQHATIFDDLMQRSRSYTAIKHNGRERVLLHMPGTVLGSGDARAIGALLAVPAPFRGKTERLFICSYGFDGPVDPSIANLMEVYWKTYYRLEGRFVAWKHLQDVQAVVEDQQAAQKLCLLLKLTEILDGGLQQVTLTGEQAERLHEALMSAFPSVSALSELALFRLGLKLVTISSGQDLSSATMALYEWAEKGGKVRDLIQAAYKKNPGNLDLKAFVTEVMPDLLND